MSTTIQPKRKLSIVGGSSYYDASASNAYRDFRDYLGGSEDHFFDSRVRAVAIARFRREVRNNPYLAGLYETFPGALGYGRARARTPDRAYNVTADAYWRGYSRTVSSQGDTLRALTLLRHAELLVAGEIFFIKLRSGRLQVIPSEYCGSTLKPENENEMNGIIYNAARQPIGYRFGKMQPTGYIDFSEANSRVIPAEHVIHDFRRDRVHMGRGIPDLISSLAPARDLYEITSAKTKQIKDASKLLGWIESGLGGDALAKLGYPVTGSEEETGTDPSTDAGDRPADETKVLEMKDGSFIALDPGEKLELLKTEYNASDYKELIYILLHAIAAPAGLPVELWFSGLGEVNYSGFKGLGTQWHRRRRELIEDCEERMLDPLYEWRMEKAHNELDLEEPKNSPDLYQHKWSWQRTAVLDEERDAKTNETRLRTGEACLVDIWEQNGLDPDEEMEKRRHLYIRMGIAAGRIDPEADHKEIKVPYEFLMYGQLPDFRAPQPPAEPVIVQPEEA